MLPLKVFMCFLTHPAGIFSYPHLSLVPVVIPNPIQNSKQTLLKSLIFAMKLCKCMQRLLQIHKQATAKLVLSALSHTFTLNALGHLSVWDVWKHQHCCSHFRFENRSRDERITNKCLHYLVLISSSKNNKMRHEEDHLGKAYHIMDYCFRLNEGVLLLSLRNNIIKVIEIY